MDKPSNIYSPSPTYISIYILSVGGKDLFPQAVLGIYSSIHINIYHKQE